MTADTVSDPDTSPAPLTAGRGSLLPLVLALTVISVAAALGGYLYYRNESAELYQDARQQLELLGQLKQTQLEQWRAERLGDAQVLQTRNAQSVNVQDALSASPSPDAVAATRAWMAGLISAYNQYDRVYLLDAAARVRIAVTPDAAQPPAALVAAARDAMHTGTTRLVDFYRDETSGNRPFLGVVSPVIDGPGGTAIGVVVLRIDPATFVWRVVGEDVGSSETGETELIRPDGADAFVLSPLRSDPSTAIEQRVAIADIADLSAIALSRRQGLVTARDQRGVEVLATVAPVRDSPWVIVSHVDIAELQGQVNRHLWLVSTGVLLLILSSGAVLALWRHDQRMRGYQRQAELSEAVREGEERLRLALSSASQGLFDLDLETGRAIVSPEYATMLGYSPDGFTETLDGWRSRLHPEDAGRVNAAVEAYLSGAAPTYRVEFRLRTAAGGWKWVLSAGQIVARDGEGRPRRMLGTHTDITQLKWAQDGQARATAQLRNLLAHSPTIVYSLHVIAGQPRLVAISENVERILGYTPVDVMQPDFWLTHAHPDDREAALKTAAAVAAEGQVSHEYRFRRRDGSWARVQDRMTVVRRDASGTPLEIAGAWSDITEQYHAEQAVRDSEERLRLAMTSARQGFWDLDLGTGRAITSPEYAAMLGYDPDTFAETAEAWNARVHPDDLPSCQQVFDDYLGGHRTDFDLEFRQRGADDRWIWIHSIGLAIERDNEGRPTRMIGIHTDITARKTAELAADRQARLFRTLSLCNEAIVRSTSADELAPQVCTAAVDAGGFHLACVVMLDPVTRAARVAGQHGAVGYLHGLEQALNAGLLEGDQPMAVALRDGATQWVDDFRTHPLPSSRRQRAAQHGIVGAAVLPLMQESKVVGVFTVYTAVEGGFDAESRQLLMDMAADISFALEGFARSARQQQADNRLRQSEARYRSMFAEGGVPMLLVDAKTGAISDANRAAADFYGWDVLTLRRMHIGDINTLPPDQVAAAVRRSASSARMRHEFRHRLASGEVRDVEAFTSAIVIDDQPRVLAFITDVTARNAAARELAEKEHELLEAQRLARVGSWTLDRGGRNEWSDELFRIFGLEGREAAPEIGEYLSLVHPDDRQRIIEQMEANQRGIASSPIDYRIVRRDGTLRHVIARGEQRTDARGDAYLAGTVQDVTELRASEAALRIKDRAIESSLNAVAIASLDGRLTYVNAAFVELWGFDSVADALGRSALSLWGNEDDAARVIGAISSQGQWSGEMRAAARDGRALDLLVSAVMVAGDSGEPVCMVGAFVDITARKRAEQTLVASLQEKEALLKEVHHRVKNNLQVISSLLRLELGRTSDAGVKAVLGEMQGRIVSMALLHETLYRADNLAHVDLSTYLTRLVNQIFRSTAPASGRVALRVATEPAVVDLEQAVPCGLLVNELVSNSLKHAFPDNVPGEVRVDLARLDGGPRLRLSVSDTGPGLPADLAGRRDQTLGLQLVSDLSRQLRGTLTIAEGPGAQFVLEFTPRPATPAAGVAS